MTARDTGSPPRDRIRSAGPDDEARLLPVPEFPEAAQRMGVTFRFLDGLPGRWVPPAVVGIALLSAAATVLVPGIARRRSAARGLLRVAGVLAAGALGTVLLAVVGDGYVELAKHVWLASYLLVVTATVLLASLLARLTRQANAPE